MNMRIYLVVCFALLAIVFRRASSGTPGDIGEIGDPGPQYPYCPVDTKIKSFIFYIEVPLKPGVPVGYNSQIKTLPKFNK
jgi:hypothetical protein